MENKTSYELEKLQAWKKLKQLAKQTRAERIADYFSCDPARFDKMSLRLGELFLDFSKNKISDEVLTALLQLAEQSPLEERKALMYSGGMVNVTEQRAVLHTALRNRDDQSICVDGHNVMPEVQTALATLKVFTDRVRQGEWRGCTGKPIRDIVNIGIGGSDLGPSMVCRALAAYQQENLKLHFVSNVDGRQIQQVLKSVDPDSTLFIVSSKTFSTQETLLNAKTAKRWFLSHEGKNETDIGAHFVAVSTNIDAALDFGIKPDGIFEFWDWVGGRYSLWSSIGLPIALAIGHERFIELLQGAHQMDLHFRDQPNERNMPVILALIGIWQINFQGAETQAIIPYDEALQLLPPYLQQLDMESNGKSVDLNGEPVNYPTGPIVWGQTGSNGQHAFFQLLHQGTRSVPIDFIASLQAEVGMEDHHFALLTNMLAQASAFMNGDANENLPDYARSIGNRSSNVLLLDSLTPHNLGMLIALYEHKVFVQGAIWNINSFDQWGVQLGKRLATEISRNGDQGKAEQDASTAGLMALVRAHSDHPA